MSNFLGSDQNVSNPVIPIGKKGIKFKLRMSQKPANTSAVVNDIYTIMTTAERGSEYNGTNVFINANGTLSWMESRGVGGQPSFIINVSNIDLVDNQWHEIFLSWNGTTNENGVKVYIDNMDSPIFTGKANYVQNGTASNNLRIGARYYSIEYNRFYKGDLDNIEIYNDDLSPLAAPLNLSTNLNNQIVNLSWDTVLGATSYNVKRATTAGGPYTTIANNIITTSYTDSTITTGDNLYYVVTAVNSYGESENSNEVSVTLSETPPPSNGNGLLVITMVNGLEKEYDLTMNEINSFIKWYDDRSNGIGNAYYTFNKTYNMGPFISRKDNIVFDKIMTFEVLEY